MYSSVWMSSCPPKEQMKFCVRPSYNFSAQISKITTGPETSAPSSDPQHAKDVGLSSTEHVPLFIVMKLYFELY